jgi:hypothetical protein
VAIANIRIALREHVINHTEDSLGLTFHGDNDTAGFLTPQWVSHDIFVSGAISQ